MGADGRVLAYLVSSWCRINLVVRDIRGWPAAWTGLNEWLGTRIVVILHLYWPH